MSVIETPHKTFSVGTKTCELAKKVITRIFQSRDEETPNDTSGDKNNTDNNNKRTNTGAIL